LSAADETDCKHEAGIFTPVIDRTRCEGKEDCATVCPYGVFEIRKLTPEEKKPLPFLARLKATAHGNRQAFATLADQCHACGLCVIVCPEQAIKLTRRTVPA
jgi:4Fe-4S ferredoxin